MAPRWGCSKPNYIIYVHYNELKHKQDEEDNDLQKISQSSIDSIERELTEKDKIKLGALLDKIISDRNEVLNKSDAERAKKKEVCINNSI